MADSLNTLARHRLEKEVADAKAALRKIECEEETIMDKGAGAFVSRVNAIYKELIECDLSPEQEQELIREKNELFDQPLYIKLDALREPRRDAYHQLWKAQDELEQLLLEEVPSTEAPPAVTAPLRSGTAASKLFSSLISPLLAHLALRMVDVTPLITHNCFLRCRGYPD